MEELKVLTEMVAGLPSMALWVIAFFFAYKVICIGSLYGVIRFCVEKWHSWATIKKIEKKTVEVKHVEIKPMLDGICVGDAIEPLIYQIKRVVGKDIGISTKYIHSSSVDWLRQAIDDKIEKDAKE